MSTYRELVHAWIAGRKTERDYAEECAFAAGAVLKALQMNLDYEPIEAHPPHPEKPGAGGSRTVAEAMSLKEDGWYELRLVFILAEGADVFPKQGVSIPAEVKIAGGRVRYKLPGAETTIAWPLDEKGTQELSAFVDLLTSALREQLAEGFRRRVERNGKAPNVGFLWLIQEPE